MTVKASSRASCYASSTADQSTHSRTSRALYNSHSLHLVLNIPSLPDCNCTVLMAVLQLPGSPDPRLHSLSAK